jgi:hypothetical protein
MAQSKKDARREIAHYAHADKERLNNPVGSKNPNPSLFEGFWSRHRLLLALISLS